jgi:hypothetical protein
MEDQRIERRVKLALASRSMIRSSSSLAYPRKPSSAVANRKSRTTVEENFGKLASFVACVVDTGSTYVSQYPINRKPCMRHEAFFSLMVPFHPSTKLITQILHIEPDPLNAARMVRDCVYLCLILSTFFVPRTVPEMGGEQSRQIK